MRKIVALLASLATLAAVVQLPARAGGSQVYNVGAASRRIDPDAPGSPLPPGTAVQKGGFGLGDGTSPVSQAIGPGDAAKDEGDHVQARAIVIDDGTTPIALVTVETQGMFAAYQRGIPGLIDIARDIERETAGALPAANIVISNDHTHSGPDMIGAWGFVPDVYARFISAQTEAVILDAWAARRPATIVEGADWTPDLIYNMNCLEALNQGQGDTYPNRPCNEPEQDVKDSWLRVMQATATNGSGVIATVMQYAAHATENLGRGLHGDWPQFMSDRLGAEFGGVGLAFEGAVGRTQPCRPRCGYTDRSTPGYEIPERREAYPAMLDFHVRRSLTGAAGVTGPIKATQSFIRHEVVNPFLYALVTHGDAIGAPIARSLDKPWVVGTTLLTPVSALALGNLLVLAAPGEAYPNIPYGVSETTNTPWNRIWTLGLANDQLGYLIAPSEAYPEVAAEVGVNDNSIFNVSPTIGDHIMCTQIRLAGLVGFPTPQFRTNPRCPAWDAIDGTGDPLGGVAP